MKTMGFRPFADGEEISAEFSSMIAFEARGVTLEPELTVTSGGIAAGVTYRLAVSTSVNGGCLALLNDVFIDDEEDWKKENKCRGPFVLVHIGPTTEQSCSSGYVKIEEDGSTTTYDCFPGARAELAQLESRALAPILSALTCVLNEDASYVALRKISRASAGRSSCGSIVHDIRMEMHAEAYVSYRLDTAQLSKKLDVAKNLTSTLNQKASRFFALGLAEQDQLKRFLYFFLALEIETHAVFGRINHSTALMTLIDGAASRRESTKKLLQTQVSVLKNLYDKFVWCATCAWPGLTDGDIDQFKALKSARDDIAHGSASEPPPGFARSAELLAHKVIWSAK
jgi:hypothetical protein